MATSPLSIAKICEDLFFKILPHQPFCMYSDSIHVILACVALPALATWTGHERRCLKALPRGRAAECAEEVLAYGLS